MNPQPFKQFLVTRALRQWVEEIAEAVANEPDEKIQRWRVGQSLLTLLAGRKERRKDFVVFIFLKALIAHANRLDVISLSSVMEAEFLIRETDGMNGLRKMLARGRIEAMARLQGEHP